MGRRVLQARLTLFRVRVRIRGNRCFKVGRTQRTSLKTSGLVEPGDYSFQLEKGWSSGYQRTLGQFNVQPGSEVHKSIVCPKAPPDRVELLIKCDWPADLEDERLVLYAPFAFRGRTLEPGMQWSMDDTLAAFRECATKSLLREWG